MFYELLTTSCVKIPCGDLHKAFSKQNSSLHKYLVKENLEPSILKSFLALHKTLKILISKFY